MPSIQEKILFKISKEELKYQYIDLEKSLRQIARELGCGYGIIQKFRIKYKIPKRKIETNKIKKITYFIDKNGCHICTSHSITGKGYPHIYFNKVHMKMSRYIYCKTHNIMNEDIKGFVIRHKCDNPSCINPSHIEIETYKDNSQDMVKRNRSIKGEKVKSSKLIENEILEIRKLYKEKKFNQYELANIFNVDRSNIGFIVNRKTWRYI